MAYIGSFSAEDEIVILPFFDNTWRAVKPYRGFFRTGPSQGEWVRYNTKHEASLYNQVGLSLTDPSPYRWRSLRELVDALYASKSVQDN